MAACRDPDVSVKVFADSQLAVESKRLLHIFEPMVDTPHIEWDMLSEVAEHNL